MKSQDEIAVEVAQIVPCHLRASSLHHEKILDSRMIHKQQSLSNQPFEVQSELGGPQHTCRSIGWERNGNSFGLVCFEGSFLLLVFSF